MLGKCYEIGVTAGPGYPDMDTQPTWEVASFERRFFLFRIGLYSSGKGEMHCKQRKERVQSQDQKNSMTFHIEINQ